MDLTAVFILSSSDFVFTAASMGQPSHICTPILVVKFRKQLRKRVYLDFSASFPGQSTSKARLKALEQISRENKRGWENMSGWVKSTNSLRHGIREINTDHWLLSTDHCLWAGLSDWFMIPLPTVSEIAAAPHHEEECQPAGSYADIMLLLTIVT